MGKGIEIDPDKNKVVCSKTKPTTPQPYYYDGRWSILTKDADGNPQRVYVDGPDSLLKPGEVYRHHSGREYAILQPVYCAETGEQMVMYREVPLYKNPKPISQKRYIHTVANFMQPGRFERVR